MGKHLFEHVIGPTGILKDKTRVLLTNAIEYLPFCDSISVLVNGFITEQGMYSTLIENDGEFSHFIEEFSKQSTEKSVTSTSPVVKNEEPMVPSSFKVQEKQKEILKEGAVLWSVFKSYMGAFGLFSIIAVFCLICIGVGLGVGQTFWLSYWSTASDDISSLGFYLGVYSSFGITQAIIFFSAFYVLSKGAYFAARTLFSDMLTRIFQVPMSFWDTTQV